VQTQPVLKERDRSGGRGKEGRIGTGTGRRTERRGGEGGRRCEG
jgi:hypothetical protein